MVGVLPILGVVAVVASIVGNVAISGGTAIALAVVWKRKGKFLFSHNILKNFLNSRLADHKSSHTNYYPIGIYRTMLKFKLVKKLEV